MRRCLDLARMAQKNVSPNPMVGAVIVVDNKIVGEGHTSAYGGPHAEVNAVEDVLQTYGMHRGKKLLRSSTVYVSLEPCAHHGKTPPCTDLLIENQVANVVVGCLDPFKKVNGQGVQQLREAGIQVTVGVLEQECKAMNRRFFTRIGKFRPYVILKWAQTADGYFAPTEAAQKWISNKASKHLVHKWRSEEDAILVGKHTAIIDNPSLTTRLWQGKSPTRILIDKNLEVPTNHTFFNNDNTDILIFNALKASWEDNKKYIQVENFDLYLPQNILYQLYLMDIQSLIIEGGKKTLESFIEADLWDEARVFVGPEEWNNGIEAPKLPNKPILTQKVSSDTLKLYQNNNLY